jgi:hypothetical protein
MDKLPCDIINNILTIRVDELNLIIERLKKEISSLKFQKEHIEQRATNMLNYLETHEIKYCDCCDCYGDDDEIIFYEDYDEWLCEYCLEFREEQINNIL